MNATRLLRRRTSGLTIMIIPLIDVIFLLLLFFVMTTSFEASARVRILLPDPESSQAQAEDPLKNIVIHCEYDETGGAGGSRVLYRFGTDPPEPLSTISARLAVAIQAQREPAVTIRADRRSSFGEVRQVMEMIADLGIPTMNVAVLRGRED
jgi:biopolymer transport protein ExbD